MMIPPQPSEPEQEVGEGFRPTDYELVNHFLGLMKLGDHQQVRRIPMVDVYKYEPWDLPHYSGLSLSGNVWYFFCRLHSLKGGRARRLTKVGYWKSTGRDRKVEHEMTGGDIGLKKSLVFHVGRTPKGVRTNWTMHQYSASLNQPNQGDFVLCKLIKRPEKKAKVAMNDSSERSYDVALDLENQNPYVTNHVPTFDKGSGSISANLGGGTVSGMAFDFQKQNLDQKTNYPTCPAGRLIAFESEKYATDIPILDELDAEVLWNLGSDEFNDSTLESNVQAPFDNGFENFFSFPKEGDPRSPVALAFENHNQQDTDHPITDTNRPPRSAFENQVADFMDITNTIKAST